MLCWARALGEFGATITFAGNFPGRTQTMPLAVYLALETDPDAAIVLSLVLLAVSVAILAGAARPLDDATRRDATPDLRRRRGCVGRTAARFRLDVDAGRRAPARWSRCSAPTAPARPPRCARWPGCIR